HVVTAAAATGARAAGVGKPKKRLGMVVDLQKCRHHAGCDGCVQACNTAHNIPDLRDPAHAVKWIWNEPFDAVFPLEQTEYTRRNYGGLPIPVLCNHCDN